MLGCVGDVESQPRNAAGNLEYLSVTECEKAAVKRKY